MTFAAFDAYVDTHAQAILDRLATFCRIPSVSAENGPAMGQAADFVVDLCRTVGIHTELSPQPAGPPIIVGKAGAGEKCLMIYNHYDVQPPDPLDEWRSPPFDPQIRDGKMFARGVADNKGDVIARLTAIQAYQQTIGPLPVRLLYVIEGEEEVGSMHLFKFSRRHEGLLRTADGCLWEYGYKNTDGQAVINLGVKGILSVELWVRTAGSDAHSSNGGIYPNAAWRLVEALATLRSPDGRVLVDGFMEIVQPPSASVVDLVDRLPFDEAKIMHVQGLKNGFLAGLTGPALLRRLYLEPTCTINGIVSGYTGEGAKTVIPAEAMAKLDFRLVPDLTPEVAKKLVVEHLARRGFHDIEVIDSEDGLLPWRTDPDAAITRAIQAALAEVTARPAVVNPSPSGSGPMYELCGLHGIPVAATGAAWYDSRIHAPNENIRVADFLENIKVIGRLLKRFAEIPYEEARR
jgi:acetylornithine deacetylase/succinyl-diaminopimelate desuccinylase-like protein